jgi:hypothetical protein
MGSYMAAIVDSVTQRKQSSKQTYFSPEMKPFRTRNLVEPVLIPEKRSIEHGAVSFATEEIEVPDRVRGYSLGHQDGLKQAPMQRTSSWSWLGLCI